MSKAERRRLARVKAKILAENNGLCKICNRAPATTLDHILPKRAGGSNEQHNLQGACFDCNNKKGGKVPSNPPVPSARALASRKSARKESRVRRYTAQSMSSPVKPAIAPEDEALPLADLLLKLFPPKSVVRQAGQQALIERVFALLPELRTVASAAWHERPQFGRWRAVSDSFVHYDAALRIAAYLARELPTVPVFPFHTNITSRGTYDSAVQIGEAGVGALILVRGRLLDGFIDLEVKRG